MDLNSQQLRERMGGQISKEDAEIFVKENLFRTIRQYISVFEGSIYKSLPDMTEQDLNEILSAIKFLFRIETKTSGSTLGQIVEYRKNLIDKDSIEEEIRKEP